eukprot:scaffold4035_cov52-Attheya_sp.AAC.2
MGGSGSTLSKGASLSLRGGGGNALLGTVLCSDSSGGALFRGGSRLFRSHSSPARSSRHLSLTIGCRLYYISKRRRFFVTEESANE